jgi:hypothetical protein
VVMVEEVGGGGVGRGGRGGGRLEGELRLEICQSLVENDVVVEGIGDAGGSGQHCPKHAW